MLSSSHFRLQRLFHPQSGRMLDVAVDHGMFGEATFLSGIEDMPSVIDRLVEAGPDAIQLSPGWAPLLQAKAGKGKPALVLRCDIANVYGQTLERHVFSRHLPSAVETAIRLDASCVVLNLLQIPERAEVRERCIEAILAIAPRCVDVGMPLMIEPLVMRPNDVSGGYMVDGDTTKITTLVRQARELGADLIKADPTSDIDDYHQVIEAAAGVPVLVRGGGRVADRDLLARTSAVLQQGASGVVYGRNIIQHRDPAAMTSAIMALLHHGATVDDAMGLLTPQSE
jgi:class I fructose-bisphosphate aldolase